MSDEEKSFITFVPGVRHLLRGGVDGEVRGCRDLAVFQESAEQPIYDRKMQKCDVTIINIDFSSKWLKLF